MKETTRRSGLYLVLVGALCCLLAATTASAQSTKSAKQAESLEKSAEKASEAVRSTLDDLSKLLDGYNAIVSGEAKDTQSAYKKLVKDLDGTGKTIDGAKKQLSSLNKEADKFFEAWEKDLADISSDSVREKSRKRLELARQRYASMGETLVSARDAFAPVVQELKDQILYMGRDLSPDALADLQDEAEALNQHAAEVTAKVKDLLQSADKTQDEAEAAIDETDA